MLWEFGGGRFMNVENRNELSIFDISNITDLHPTVRLPESVSLEDDCHLGWVDLIMCHKGIVRHYRAMRGRGRLLIREQRHMRLVFEAGNRYECKQKCST